MSGPRTQGSDSTGKPPQAGGRGFGDVAGQVMRSLALRARNMPLIRLVGRKIYNRLPLILQDRLRRLTQRPVALHAVGLSSADELSARGRGFYDDLRQTARGARAQ